jgi:hypothetical protein
LSSGVNFPISPALLRIAVKTRSRFDDRGEMAGGTGTADTVVASTAGEASLGP